MASLTIFAVFVALVATTQALYVVPNAGCLYDGRMYGRGDIMQIAGCLGEMTCLGNNNLSPIRPSSSPECNYLYQADGQTGCLYDGRVYATGDIMQIAGCLGEMTCLGNNNLSPIRPSSSPECNYLYKADGQTGCLYDGRVYATGDIMQIAGCLGEMTCLGNNNLSSIRPSSRPECNYVLYLMNVLMGNGQTGCLFDGKIYKKGDVVQIEKCLGEMTCLGDNIYTPLRPSNLPQCN